jgi:hypothetical protein
MAVRETDALLREKLDNLHFRLAALERESQEMRLLLKQVLVTLQTASARIEMFDATYKLSLYHAVVQRILTITGADLRAVLVFLTWLVIILYALLTGFNLFTATILDNLPSLWGGTP